MKSSSEKTNALKKIRDEVWELTTSPLYAYRVESGGYPVLGEGDHDAEMMFVGEAPGKNEAATGRPFCGAAGRVLDELFASSGLDRAQVYVTNIVKDRPPENRDPTMEEIELYAPFLDRQIEIIEPTVLVPLGRFSMAYILERYGTELIIPRISEAHGQRYEGEARHGPVSIIPLYHPAAAIYNSHLKETLINDLNTVVAYVQKQKNA